MSETPILPAWPTPELIALATLAAAAERAAEVAQLGGLGLRRAQRALLRLQDLGLVKASPRRDVRSPFHWSLAARGWDELERLGGLLGPAVARRAANVPGAVFQQEGRAA